MFFVIIYSVIDQGYIGLSLASCHKDEIWDLPAELGLIWDHFRALVPTGTNFPKRALFLLFGFFFSKTKFSETKTFFQDQIFLKPKPRLFFPNQIFQNWNWYFFPKPIFLTPKLILFLDTKFSETKTYFPRPNFLTLKPKPSKIGKSFKPRSFESEMSISTHMCSKLCCLNEDLKTNILSSRLAIIKM